VDAAAVAAAVLATAALVLPYYTRRPFWFDELVSVEIAGLGPRSLGEYVFGVESNMALYHGALGLWLEVTSGEAGVRALSIAFALLALPFLYALGRRLFDRRTAVLAVALMSVNVSYVGYSRDARSYALTLMLVTASSDFLVRAADDSRRADWVLYVATAALAVWSHLFAGLVVAAQLAWLFIARPASWRTTTALSGALGLLLLPLGLAIVLGGQEAQLDWLTRPGPQKLPGLVLWFVESKATLVVYFFGAAFALGNTLATWRRGSSPWPSREAFLLLWLLLPPLVAFAASYAAPVYLYRYFLVCLPALVLLVSAGFARMRPLWLGVALAAAAFALSVRTVESCQPGCKIRHDDWRAAAQYLEARTRPGDAIVVYPAQVRTPLDHYLGQRPRLLYPNRWELDGGGSDGGDLPAALRNVRAYSRIWLVTWWLPAEPARGGLSSRAQLVAEREFQGNVRVALYAPLRVLH
jgi:mannosyltransferase